MVSWSGFVPAHHAQVFGVDGVVDVGLAGLGLGRVLGVTQARVGVSDGQVVSIEIPVTGQVPAHRIRTQVTVEVHQKQGGGSNTEKVKTTANDRYSGKTVRLLSSKAVVSSKPVKILN